MSPSSSRLDSLDLLRGSALLGILVINLSLFAHALYANALPPYLNSSADVFAQQVATFVFEGKFYVLFSFLFGYGAALLLQSEESTSGSRYRRRLVGLIVLGSLHGSLFFSGDILLSYGLLGFWLWSWRHWPLAHLLRMALLCLCLAAALRLLLMSGGADYTSDAGVLKEIAQAKQHYLGSFSAGLQQRLQDWPLMLGVTFFVGGPHILSCFLLGYAAARQNLFADPERVLRLLRPALPGLLALGLGGNLLYTLFQLPPGQALYAPASALQVLAAPALSACYVYALLRWQLSERTPRLRAALQAAGRLSLSHYLGQALICSWVFNGWGLGQFGRWGALSCLLFALGLFALQVAVSPLWLRSFRLGPAEWLLRSWSTGRWQSLRL